MAGPPRPGPKLPLNVKEERTATAQHTYPPPEDGPPLQRRALPPIPNLEVPAAKDRPDSIEFARRQRERAELAERRAQEAEQKLERASQVDLQVEVEKAELEEGAERARIRRAWNIVGLKIAGSIAAIMAIVALYFGVWAKSIMEPKVVNTVARQAATETVSDAVATRQAAVEKYLRLKHNRDACIQAQERSAVVRGTGHDLESLPDTGVHWNSENAQPKLQARILWPEATWYPVAKCPAEPIPPGCTAAGCPDEQ